MVRLQSVAFGPVWRFFSVLATGPSNTTRNPLITHTSRWMAQCMWGVSGLSQNFLRKMSQSQNFVQKIRKKIGNKKDFYKLKCYGYARWIIILVCKLDLMVYVSATSQATSYFGLHGSKQHSHGLLFADNIPTGCCLLTTFSPNAARCSPSI